MNAKKIWLGIGIAIVIIVALWAYFHSTTLAAVGNLNIYNGTVSVARGSAQIAGQTGTEINASDKITVSADGRASIIFKDGTVVRLGAGSVFSVSDVAYHDGKISHAVLDLSTGKAWSNVEPVDASGTFEVETPTVVATVRGTIFDVWYHDKESEVHVSNHAVAVALRADPSNTKSVDAGSVFAIRDANATSDFAIGPQVLTPQDDWTRFNEEEDAKLAAAGVAATASTTATPSAPSTAPIIKTTVPPPAVTVPAATPPATQGGVVLKSLALTADNATISQDGVIQLIVTAQYSDGTTANVTKQVTWSLSPALNIVDTQGIFHASFTGTTNITASWNGVKSNVLSIDVSQQAVAQPVTQPTTQSTTQPAQVTLASIVISYKKSTPTYYSVAVMLPTVQFSAMANYSNSTSADVTTQVQWSASGSAGGAIDTAGNYVPRTSGTETITATWNGVSGSVQISIP